MRSRRSNRDTRNLTGQALITSVIKSRRLQWAVHMVRALEEKRIHKVLYGRTMGRRPRAGQVRRGVNNVRQDATCPVGSQESSLSHHLAISKPSLKKTTTRQLVQIN